MRKLKIRLENCYGIRSLDTEFDFTNKSAKLIYAPNGSMKSSFAKTFSDLSQNIQSRDRVYTDRKNIRKITDENGIDLKPEEVFVAKPYDESYESGRVSTLLVNRELKSEFDEILRNLDQLSKKLMTQLRKTSGVNSGLEDIISKVFVKEPGKLLRAFGRIENEILTDPLDSSLTGIKFNSIFSERIERILSDPEVKVALGEYTEIYDALLKKSRFFRKGVFNHYNAQEVAKQLKNHGFFKADHTVSLYAGNRETRVNSENELANLIGEEMSAIESNESLKQSFEKIEKKLTTVELRNFRELLLNQRSLIPRLQNPELLKEDLLKSYLMTHRQEFNNLMDQYKKDKERLDEITTQASNQATRWQEVINIFNRRFSVPFKLTIENKEDVILRRDTPNIGFEFEEFEDESAVPKPLGRDELMDILSRGERRALYLLNVIFEVEARKNDAIPTLLIVDDIADSFDYKNKYAIVEYISDILGHDQFKQIILTHNYDFYRTVWHRLDLSGANLHASKSSSGIVIKDETMYRDPFQKWKNEASAEKNTEALIALIPFVRNLAEYCGRKSEYRILTSLLHIKSESHTITVSNLLDIFTNILNQSGFGSTYSDDKSMVPIIVKTAISIADSGGTELELKKKIVLSIGIRLIAEQIMLNVINDCEFVAEINTNQTIKLTKRLKEEPNVESGIVRLMDQVNLMTPENIHLNSFMYEPILDMSSRHLSDLCNELHKYQEQFQEN